MALPVDANIATGNRNTINIRMMIQGCFWVLLLIANEICGSLFSANLGITYVLMAILEYGKSTELEFRNFFRIVMGGG